MGEEARGGAGPKSTTKWRRHLPSFLWPEIQSPEVAAVVKPHSPLRSAASNFLQRQGSYSQPEAARSLACLPARRDSFAKSNLGFRRVRGFLEPSCHPSPIKHHLGASELPQARSKVSLIGPDKAWFLVSLKL